MNPVGGTATHGLAAVAPPRPAPPFCVRLSHINAICLNFRYRAGPGVMEGAMCVLKRFALFAAILTLSFPVLADERVLTGAEILERFAGAVA